MWLLMKMVDKTEVMDFFYLARLEIVGIFQTKKNMEENFVPHQVQIKGEET